MFQVCHLHYQFNSTRRNKLTIHNFRYLSSQTVFGTSMLLFYVSDSESNITFLTQGLSTDAIDSGVLLLRSDDLKSSATLSELYLGHEIPLASGQDGIVRVLTKHPFVWHRRSNFWGRQFRAVSR